MLFRSQITDHIWQWEYFWPFKYQFAFQIPTLVNCEKCSLLWTKSIILSNKIRLKVQRKIFSFANLPKCHCRLFFSCHTQQNKCLSRKLNTSKMKPCVKFRITFFEWDVGKNWSDHDQTFFVYLIATLIDSISVSQLGFRGNLWVTLSMVPAIVLRTFY